jgi:phage FluMu gp28-like protein
VWRDVTERFAPIQTRINTQDKRVEYATGGTLEFWSLENRRAARSRKYARVIIDEAAFCQDLDVMWRRSIRPTLTDLSGDAWFISTPDGRNAFYRMWQFAQDRPTWYTVQRSSWDNPFLPVADLEDLKQQLPERDYLQEIMAQFISEDGSVFRNVNAAITLDRPLTEPDPNSTYVFGVDWGRTNDATVCVILDITQRQVVYVDRMVRTGFELQVGRLKMLYDRWRPTTILAETNSMGLPLMEQMQKFGMPLRGFTTSNATKAEAIEKLALAIEKGEIGLLNHDKLIQELIAYTQEKTATGLFKYGAPQGEHDDCVMALAIAWHGVSNPSLSMLEWYRNRVGVAR